MERSTISPNVSLELLCSKSTLRVILTPNVVLALKEIRKTESLNAATKRLHMGYSNTYYAISNVEKALGFKILERSNPKGSTLTEEGVHLVEFFESLEAKTQDFADSLVAQAYEQGVLPTPLTGSVEAGIQEDGRA